MSILLGAIADDFTGATDLANTLVKQGMRTTQVIGVPDENTDIGDAQAVIVALKSRTGPVADAVEKSLAALQWLQTMGAQQIFFKYCSTFDSTGQGNIGPVSDALMQALNTDFAFICPAFPTNGRTIYKGQLFVGDLLLSESSMKDHPLTPMRDANLMRLMDKQSKRHSSMITLQDVRQGSAQIIHKIQQLKSEGFSYAVVDAVDDHDLMLIGEAAAGHQLITGGSGVALGLPANFHAKGLLHKQQNAPLPVVEGKQLVLAGSCSTATRGQIRYLQTLGWPNQKINVAAIANGEDVSGQLIEWAKQQDLNKPVLIYASADPNEIGVIQERYGVEQSGAMVETVMGALAVGLANQGFRKLVVAGGETSGAVVSALQIKALRIGPEIAPGVPWTEALNEQPIALALKSGNFGAQDFFAKAFGMLP